MKRIPSIVYYWFKAKKRHGTHSPFVYDFVDRCLSRTLDKKDEGILTAYSKKLAESTTVLEITDFGAGSRKLSNQRKVKDVAKISGAGDKYGQLLYQIVRHYSSKHILELGTSLGKGTLAMHLGNPLAKIVSIEGCAETHAYTQEKIPVDRTKVELINSTFTEYIEHLDGDKFDLIYIDGDHRGLALMKYVEMLKKHSHPQTIWILDDIRWSDDMWEAWQKLTSNEHFHVSIDVLRMGILVQRPEQFKEHFYVRL